MKSTALLLLMSLAWTCIASAQSAPHTTAPLHVWHQSQKNDTARSFTYTQFTLTGKFLSAPHDPVADRPALALDCIPGSESRSKGKFLAANLLVGTTLKIIFVLFSQGRPRLPCRRRQRRTAAMEPGNGQDLGLHPQGIGEATAARTQRRYNFRR
jgi:hypothetical protein